MIRITPETVHNVIFELWPHEEPAMIFVTEHNDVYMYCAYLSEYLPKYGYEMGDTDDASLNKDALKGVIAKVVVEEGLLG